MIPPSIRTFVSLLGALVALSALATLVACFAVSPRPLWALAGFELITILAGGFAIAAGRGRFSDGPGLALACVSGTVLASSVFGYLGATGQIGDWKLHWWLSARCGVAAIFALLGAWVVLRRTPGAAALALRGLIYTMAAIGFTGVFMLFDGHLRPAGSGTRLVAHAFFSFCALVPIPVCLVFALLTLVSRAKDGAMPGWMRLIGQLSIPVFAGGILILCRGDLDAALAGPQQILRTILLVALSISLIGSICAGVHILVGAFASCAFPNQQSPNAPTPTPTTMPTQGATSS